MTKNWTRDVSGASSFDFGIAAAVLRAAAKAAAGSEAETAIGAGPALERNTGRMVECGVDSIRTPREWELILDRERLIVDPNPVVEVEGWPELPLA